MRILPTEAKKDPNRIPTRCFGAEGRDMEYRMYGWGSTPAQSLPALHDAGFGTVTGGWDAEAAGICRSLGLAYRLSVTGFAGKAPYVCADGTVLPEERCPCDPAGRQARLETLRTAAAREGVSGITVDYCRFPSMLDGNPHFFGCFCEGCMRRMEAAGFDAERIRAAVRIFQRAAAGIGEGRVDADALADWIRWKQQTITAHFRSLRDTVKRVSPDLRFGAYLFAPSLAPLVGQDCKALDGIADDLSPMLYRYWPHPEGEACLDRELCGLIGAAERSRTAAEALAACGFDPGAFPGSRYLEKNGVNVTHIISETEKARRLIRQARLVPICLLEDRYLTHTLDGMRPYCNGFDFFLYSGDFASRIGKI